MKKKLILGAMASLALAATMGVAYTSNSNSFKENNNIQLLSSTVDLDVDSFQQIPGQIDSNYPQTVELDGFIYTYDSISSSYKAKNTTLSPNDTAIRLVSFLYGLPVDYTSVSLSNYTNVNKVIVTMNDPKPAYVILKNLTKEFDLYIVGQFLFDENITSLNIKDLYLCEMYGLSASSFYSAQNLAYLNGSKIKNIYGFSNGGNFFTSYGSYIVDANLKQSDNLTPIEYSELDSSELPFDYELLNPYEGFTRNPPYLGISGDKVMKNLTNDEFIEDQFDYTFDEADSKLDTLYLDTCINSNDFKGNFNRIVYAGWDGVSTCQKISVNELVLFNSKNTVSISYFDNVKSIRFYPADETGGEVINSFNINPVYTENLEKIYIPTQFAESHFQKLIDNSIASSKIEYYDYTTYDLPTMSSFTSYNGNTYEVEDQTIPIQTLEEEILNMSEAGVVPTTDKPVDVQIKEYYENVNSDDVDSEYDVIDIEHIYTSPLINGKSIPSAIRDYLVYLNGESVGNDIEIGTLYEPNDNLNDYTFRLVISLPDGTSYTKDIEVTILDSTEPFGFAKLSNGLLVAVAPYTAKVSSEQLETSTNAFFKNELNLNTSIKLPENFKIDATGAYTGITYGNDKEMVFINSGLSSVSHSTEQKPVDDSALMSGYKICGSLFFTSNYNIEDVVKVVGRHILLNNGIFVDENYDVNVSINSSTISYEVVLDGEVVVKNIIGYKTINDSNVGNFIYATAGEFKTGYLFVEKGSKGTFQQIHDYVMINCLKASYGPSFNESIDLNESGETTLEGVIKCSTNYYNYKTLVEVGTLDDALAETNVTVTSNTFDDLLEDIKDKIETNKAYQALAIAVGSITGLLLLWLVYKLFKKLFKWLKH